MGRFQSCKGVLERSLRRAFYDGVLELYEGHGSSDTVTAVTLEGTLTLTINKMETLIIRLNEVAQRAEEISLEQEDPVHITQEQGHSSAVGKEGESSGKKRKQEPADEQEDDKKVAIKKKLKTETTVQEMKTEVVQEHPGKSSDAEKDVGLPHVTGDGKTAESPSKTLKPKPERVESCGRIQVKKEPPDCPAECVSEASPGPSSSPSTSSKMVVEDTASSTMKSGDSSLMASPKGSELSFSVEVKKEPKVESILIEDDEDDEEEEAEDLSRGNCSSSSTQQVSPVHSLWYKRIQGSRHHSSSHRISSREHGMRKSYPAPQRLDTANPHPVAMLLERNDCPVCGEVLHTRKELSSHLHMHRHALRGSCSVCRANTLTLDALLLHLSTVHSPRLLPVASSVTSDSLLSQALMPALPYTPTPMSAIASLVSMAACQAGGPSSTAFLAAGSGMAGGMSSLMEQIMTYRGLLPCPLCQLLCSSKQHLATHLALMHGDSSSLVGQGEEDTGEEVKAESRQDSDGEGSSNFSCFDCSLGFSSQAAFTQHCMLQHNTTSAVSQGSCSVCHRAFHTWKALHTHYLSAHGVTNFCDRCKMGFVSTSELKAHYDSMHSTDTRNLAFICDICNKGFYSQSQCSAHKRSHISEKSFACQVCGSAFFKRGDLSKHFRTVHAPNRVFSCRFCGKRGTRMDNMRSHVKSHGKHMTRDEVLSFIEEVSPN